MTIRACPHARPFRRFAAGAFTLIELLVVIAIIAILMALILPNMGGFIRKGHQSTSASNLRNWYVGFTGATGDDGGQMPTSGFEGGSFDPRNEVAWYNRMARALKIHPYADFGTPGVQPKIGERSVWNNPAVTNK